MGGSGSNIPKSKMDLKAAQVGLYLCEPQQSLALGLQMSWYVGVNKASLGAIVFCPKSWTDHLELWSRTDLRGLQAASMEFTFFAPSLAQHPWLRHSFNIQPLLCSPFWPIRLCATLRCEAAALQGWDRATGWILISFLDIQAKALVSGETTPSLPSRY